MIHFAAELARCPFAISFDRANFSAVLAAALLVFYDCLAVAEILCIRVVGAPRLTPWSRLVPLGWFALALTARTG